MSHAAVTADSRASRPGTENRLLTLVGGHFTRHTLIYVAGMLAVGPFGMISVAVMTRLLPPAQYGEIAILMFFAGYATMLYNTGSLQGTFMWAYGVSGGEGGEDADISSREVSSVSQRALGTGVVLTLIIVSVGTAVCCVLAPTLSQALLHRSSGASLVRWAAVSAAAGSLWRLTITVFRMERKPARFAAFNALRPLFVVAGSLVLVALGFGVQGAVAGTALGTFVACGFCIAMAHESYALAFSWSDAGKIMALGSRVVIPVLCLYGIHTGDIALLSRFAPAHELGIYKTASNFATVPAYFAGAFLIAWSPLEHGIPFQAAYRYAGEERVRGAILTYFLVAALTIVVLLDVTSSILVLIAGPGYRSAAPLIPLIGIGYVFYGLYVVLVRTIQLKRRLLWYALGALIAGLIDVALSTVTIPWLGAYGAPLATMGGLVVACLLWIVLARLQKVPLSFQARPLVGLAAAFATAGAVQAAGLSLWPAGRPAVLAAVLLAYLAAIAGFGVVPRRHLRPLSRLARAATRNGMGTQDPTATLGRLDARRRGLLVALERDGVPAIVLAERLGRDESELRREYVAIMRELIGALPPPPELAELDDGVGGFLLSRQVENRRDLLGHELVEQGVDPIELMELDEAAKRVRALPAQAWTNWTAETQSHSHSHRVRPAELVRHLAALPRRDRTAAVAILRDGATPAQAGAMAAMPAHLAATRVVRMLRELGGLGRGGPHDVSIGEALFGSPASEGRPPEARAVGLLYDQIRGFSRRHWRRMPDAQPRLVATAPPREPTPDAQPTHAQPLPNAFPPQLEGIEAAVA